MADIFTDGPVFEEDQGTVPEPVAPAPAVQPAATPVPVPDQQDTVADQTDTAGGSPDIAGQEPAQGVEEVPDAGTVDYTALLEQLIQQNEKQQELMETLVRENKKLEQDIKNIQNAMPSMMCMLGVIIGVLLLHILASYIRPSENMMEDELLTTPEAETEDTVEITDGEPKVSEAPQQTESLTLAVEDYNMIAVKSIPIGALSGAIFMIIGFAYLGIVHIFKKV